jgi:hypothetical protein
MGQISAGSVEDLFASCSWLEHKIGTEVAVLAPMSSCQAVRLSSCQAVKQFCQQCTRWSGRYVRFDADPDAGSKACSSLKK